MKIFTPQGFLLAIKGKHLLLDTNFFIDASNHKSSFKSLVKTFLENDATLVSIESIRAEFFKVSPSEVSIVDLLLGATLIKYQKNLCLITKDIKDFPVNIFRRLTHFSLMGHRSIQSYGIYDYSQTSNKMEVDKDDIPF
jgi:hypothetical protein